MAYTVAPFVECGRGHLVKVVRTARPIETFGDVGYHSIGPSWVCEGSVTMDDGRVERVSVISDECLRPIRDPGDDARDETLDWLPVPSKEGMPV